MNLPRPEFVRINPEADTLEMVAEWESLTGNTLYPAQVERLLINLLSYRENLIRVAIQYAGEQCLVNYATSDRLDQLGALLNVERLSAAPSRTTLRFTLDAPLAIAVSVPRGTRASAGGGVNFATDDILTIAAGATQGTITATATTAGTIGNDLAIGAIATLVDPLPGIAVTVSNTTMSNSGADVESDERYRTRLKLAPSQFSVAGPAAAYEFFARSVSPTIRAVSVTNPSDVFVDVYLLTDTGLPSAELIAAVQATLDNDRIRPLTDIVTVKAPSQVNYSIVAAVTLYDYADQAILQNQLNNAIAAYVGRIRSSLGADVVRSQIVAALSLEGVYNVQVTTPASDVTVSPSQWAVATATTVTIAGTVMG